MDLLISYMYSAMSVCDVAIVGVMLLRSSTEECMITSSQLTRHILLVVSVEQIAVVMEIKNDLARGNVTRSMEWLGGSTSKVCVSNMFFCTDDPVPVFSCCRCRECNQL